MKIKLILQKEAMSYKQQIKGDELITKFRVIRNVLVHAYPRGLVADKFLMHRNSVRNIIESFESNIDPSAQEVLLRWDNKFSRLELEDMLKPILNSSRAPKSNKRSANKEQEALIVKYTEENNVKIWSRRMHNIIKRKAFSCSNVINSKDGFDKDIDTLKWLTFSQLKWIYKRNNIRVQKVRAYNWTSTPLYDYDALAAFERLHLDTKSILDKKALPEAIYNKFKLRKDLPIIEWNIICAKSRFRFIAYSNERTSIFWLNFLIFVIQYLRSNNIVCEDLKIIIGTDNGSEFFQGSERKKKEWNNLLWIMNAEIYAYDPRFDVRKNLIERSHRTDDEEFFVPRWSFINNRKSFTIEAIWYSYYFNNLRSHSWIWMNWMTPIEKLKSCWIHNTDKLLQFPLMILEDEIWELLRATEAVRIIWYINNARHKSRDSWKRFDYNARFKCDIRANFSNFDTLDAQNVFDYYL